MTGCLCTHIPRQRAGEVRNARDDLVHAFHLDCPDHGIKVLADRPMRKVFKRAFLTRPQLEAVRMERPARVIQKHPDGIHALVEVVDWESQTEEAQPNGGPETTAGELVPTSAAGS